MHKLPINKQAALLKHKLENYMKNSEQHEDITIPRY